MQLPNFGLYNDFCAGHNEALGIIRAIDQFAEWDLFERRCAQHVAKFFTPDTPGNSIPLDNLSPRVSSLPLNAQSLSPIPPALITRAQSSKLRFQDYLIKPVQQICRYPLILGQVLKHWNGLESATVWRAWNGLRKIAEVVDAAQRAREGELRTRTIAARLQFQSVRFSFPLSAPADATLRQSINVAFCDILGPTLLVGSLHVLHRWATPDLKIKYYGCFLYRSHLFMVKVRRRVFYEPREWLPVRLFELVDVPEGEGTFFRSSLRESRLTRLCVGLLPYCIRLSYHQHQFDLSASCAAEKQLWIAALTTAQANARSIWNNQARKSDGSPTLFDDATVSSIIPPIQGLNISPNNPAIPLPLRNHARSRSTVSMSALTDIYAEPIPVYDYSALNSAAPSPDKADFPPLPAVPGRNRFSTTASSLMGRTPASQRATIDLRLHDVFSESLLAARLQGGRDSEPSPSARTSIEARRGSTLPATTKAMRRKSAAEELDTKKSALGLVFDPEPLLDALLIDTKTIKRAKTFGGIKRTTLHPIDTIMASPSKRRSVFGFPSATTPVFDDSTTLSAISDPEATTPNPFQNSTATIQTSSISHTPSSHSVDVERNNSVSSTASGTSEASSSYRIIPVDSPASSLPVSPSHTAFDLDPIAHHPVKVSTWGTINGAVGRLSRRKSSIGIASNAEVDTATSTTTAPPTATFSYSTLKRSSTSYFKARVQSSPSLSNYFGSPLFLSPVPRTSPPSNSLTPCITPPRSTTPIHTALTSSPKSTHPPSISNGDSPPQQLSLERATQPRRRATEPGVAKPPVRKPSLKMLFSKLSLTPMANR